VLELRVPMAQSLKDKRSAIRPILEGGRRRLGVSITEVRHLDAHQRATIAAAAVDREPGGVAATFDALERLVWSRPDVEVVTTARQWMEVEQ
jgi:uncharacterized protein YlxP (DUF503 family)